VISTLITCGSVWLLGTLWRTKTFVDDQIDVYDCRVRGWWVELSSSSQTTHSLSCTSLIAWIPPKQLSRSILVTCSRGCRWHVTRRSGMSDEDATRIFARMSTTSRACWARGIWRKIRHTDKRAAQPTNQVSAWHAEWRSRPTRRTGAASSQASSGGCRACRACRRGFHEDALRKLLPWNSSLIAYFIRLLCYSLPVLWFPIITQTMSEQTCCVNEIIR